MNGHSKPEGRRAVIDVEEQIPRSETIALRKKHVGPSCKLFFNKGNQSLSSCSQIHQKGAKMILKWNWNCLKNPPTIHHDNLFSLKFFKRAMKDKEKEEKQSVTEPFMPKARSSHHSNWEKIQSKMLLHFRSSENGSSPGSVHVQRVSRGIPRLHQQCLSCGTLPSTCGQSWTGTGRTVFISSRVGGHARAI